MSSQIILRKKKRVGKRIRVVSNERSLGPLRRSSLTDIPERLMVRMSSAGFYQDVSNTNSVVATFNLNHLVQATTSQTNTGFTDLASAYGFFRVQRFSWKAEITNYQVARPVLALFFVAPPAGVAAPSTASFIPAQPGFAAQFKTTVLLGADNFYEATKRMRYGGLLHKFVKERAYLSDDNYAGTLNASGSATAPATLVVAYLVMSTLATIFAATTAPQVVWEMEQEVELFSPRY